MSDVCAKFHCNFICIGKNCPTFQPTCFDPKCNTTYVHTQMYFEAHLHTPLNLCK